MLVLNRKKGQSIFIGDNIRITVIDVQGDHIKIGVDAPREISVHRQEIYDEITATNLLAVSTGTGADMHQLFDDLIKGQG